MDQARDRSGRGRLCRALVALLPALLVGACAEPGTPDFTFVAREWAKNVNALHIYPVYPPREDFQAGDLFLARKRVDKGSVDPGERTSLYVGHIDLTAEIKKHYAQRFRFPKTAEKSEQGKIWQQSAEANEVFGAQSHVALPIVRFPGFTFARLTRTQAGASLPFRFLTALFGGATIDEETVNLSVPAAESYGLPAAHAYQKYRDYCYRHVYGEEVAPECDPSVLRYLLSSLPGGFSPERDRPVMVLVTEVFYAREIDYSFGASAGFGLEAGVLLKLKSVVEAHKVASDLRAKDSATPASGGTTPPDAARAAPGSPSPDYLRLLNQLETALKVYSAADTPGAGLSVISVSSEGITLRQTFPRPVAIGYRSISFGMPEPPAAKEKSSDTGSRSAADARATGIVPLFDRPVELADHWEKGEPLPHPPNGDGPILLRKPDDQEQRRQQDMGPSRMPAQKPPAKVPDVGGGKGDQSGPSLKRPDPTRQ